ncbi:MAG: hypothetical protein K9J79_12375, partial [Desulfobacteraceae bacterium]|nr:hypothetical protein [Desulfobacteraceae bacterium]
MEKEQPQLDILKKYLKLLLNRYRLIAACVLLAVSAGIFVYLYQPEIYQSSASIMYQEQKITPSKFSQDSKQQMQEMVNTISQQVLSRTNLEKVIKEFNLYAHMRQNLPIEDVIERMRENHVEISLHQGKGNVFSVAFKGRDPRTVMRVTNSLASKFIEENLRIREEQARERASYIQDELRMAKERLNKKEAQMRDYKLKHYNEMPQQR